MKVSEYIAALEALKAEHGDLEVTTYMGGVYPAGIPVTAYRLLRTEKYWHELHNESRKGEKVIRV